MKIWLCFLFSVGLTTTFTSCRDDEVDTDKDAIVWDEDDPTLKIDEDALIGTWYQAPSSSCGNEHYISFDGNGNGQMVYVADYFRNIAFPGYIDSEDDPMGRLVYFSYSVVDNQIKIFPTPKAMASFTITVLDQSKGSITLNFPDNFIIGKPAFEKYNINPEWFSEYGPASIDLTKNLVGQYRDDDDRTYKFTVTKVNDYTLTIIDERKGTSTTGQLYWFELYNQDHTGYTEALLHPLDNTNNPGWFDYSFDRDNKLIVGTYGIPFKASKI